MPEQKKHIDDFFREKMAEHTEAPPSFVWKTLEHKLDSTATPPAPGVISYYKWLQYGVVICTLTVLVFLGYRKLANTGDKQPQQAEQLAAGMQDNPTGMDAGNAVAGDQATNKDADGANKGQTSADRNGNNDAVKSDDNVASSVSGTSNTNAKNDDQPGSGVRASTSITHNAVNNKQSDIASYDHGNHAAASSRAMAGNHTLQGSSMKRDNLGAYAAKAGTGPSSQAGNSRAKEQGNIVVKEDDGKGGKSTGAGHITANNLVQNNMTAVKNPKPAVGTVNKAGESAQAAKPSGNSGQNEATANNAVSTKNANGNNNALKPSGNAAMPAGNTGQGSNAAPNATRNTNAIVKNNNSAVAKQGNNDQLAPQAASANNTIAKEKPLSTPDFLDDLAAKKEAKKKIYRTEVEEGIKLGYEMGFNHFAANKYVIAPYIQYNIGKLGIALQPAIKIARNSHTSNLGNTDTYYTITNDPYYTQIGDTIYAIDSTRVRTYAYSETHDSILIGHHIETKSYAEIEIPLLLKYKATKNISVFGGFLVNYSNTVVKIQKDMHVYSNTGSYIYSDSFNANTIPPDVPEANTVFHYPGVAYVKYSNADFENASTMKVRTGYMLGASYMINDKFMIDISMQQGLSKMNYVPNKDVRGTYTQPYVRISAGYQFFKNTKSNKKIKKY